MKFLLGAVCGKQPDRSLGRVLSSQAERVLPVRILVFVLLRQFRRIAGSVKTDETSWQCSEQSIHQSQDPSD